MHPRQHLPLLLAIAIAAAPSLAGDVKVTRFGRRLVVTNPSDQPRPNAIVTFPCRPLAALVPDLSGVEVSDGDVALPTQLDDLDADRVPDEIVLQVDLEPNQTRTLWLASLKPSESGFQPAKCAAARSNFRHVGYAALESRQAAYGLACSFPKGTPRPALQLDPFGKRAEQQGLCLASMDTAPNAKPDSALPTWLLPQRTALGLGGPVIGGTPPVDGQTATMFHRVLCDGPLRAGIQVDVLQWRTAGQGVYQARFQYFVYAGQEFVELRASIQTIRPSDERLGIGMADLPQVQARYADATLGYMGQWGQAAAGQPGVGQGVVFHPQDVVRLAAAPPSLAPGRIAYLQPKLSDRETHRWRVLLVADWEPGGRVAQATFVDRLARLADELESPSTTAPSRQATEPPRSNPHSAP